MASLAALAAHWPGFAPTFLAAFLAATVEAVEALTVVLAVGAVRGWRSALLGTGLALLGLALLVALLGPAIVRLPQRWLALGLGALLLLFGLRWLQKAILREAGLIARHDEAAVYRRESEGLARHPAAGAGWDRLALGTAFNITLIEGIEVVFIVLAMGEGGRGPLRVAALAAGLALLMVALLGALLMRPLAMIPENILKFAVGVVLCGFGSFWAGEAMGIVWPLGDGGIVVLCAGVLVVAVALVPLCRTIGRSG